MNLPSVVKPCCRTTLNQEAFSLCLCFAANSHVGQGPGYREMAIGRVGGGYRQSRRKCESRHKRLKRHFFFLKRGMQDKLGLPFPQTYDSNLKTTPKTFSYGGPSSTSPWVSVIKIIWIRQPHRENPNDCDPERSGLSLQCDMHLFPLFQISVNAGFGQDGELWPFRYHRELPDVLWITQSVEDLAAVLHN